MRKGLILKDSHKDLNLSQNTKASLGKSNITDIFYMSDKSLHGYFQGIHCLILFLKTEREELLFISPGNRSHNLAPKFETLSIPY